jgi:exonuclease III
MKIATFNINNINSRLPNLLNWLATAKPDAVCLQELKVRILTQAAHLFRSEAAQRSDLIAPTIPI